MGEMVFKKEVRRGIVSCFHYYCSTCEKDLKIYTHSENVRIETNKMLVWVANSVGIGYAQTEQLVNILNLPMMSSKYYRKIETIVGEEWELILQKEMTAAGEEERRQAIEAGNLEKGIPFITVIIDGGWAKRSYGHGFRKKTGKLLFLGTRRILKTHIPRLSIAVRSAISNNSKEGSDLQQLRQDLKNGPYHVFGDHKNCRIQYCKRQDKQEMNHVPLLQQSDIFSEISHRLTTNTTTNYAERYMSLVSKFSGGKRVNYCQRGSYFRRCVGAGLSYNNGPSWHNSCKKSTKVQEVHKTAKRVEKVHKRARKVHKTAKVQKKCKNSAKNRKSAKKEKKKMCKKGQKKQKKQKKRQKKKESRNVQKGQKSAKQAEKCEKSAQTAKSAKK
ncbi:hypothetical protein RI129_011891 [Pyrocoelia pectoralis]|uniref:Mutator-like transposase domain-containing protein n=1 Tax=Pyrocoelia pectoralis TaxID=417401 RepID=A0AAN7V3M8_9COLE